MFRGSVSAIHIFGARFHCRLLSFYWRRLVLFIDRCKDIYSDLWILGSQTLFAAYHRRGKVDDNYSDRDVHAIKLNQSLIK